MAWIDAHVACGDFSSVEEAVRQLVDERLIEDDNLSWAKPLVDDAVAEAEGGDVMSLDEHKARNAARLATMRG